MGIFSDGVDELQWDLQEADRKIKSLTKTADVYARRILELETQLKKVNATNKKCIDCHQKDQKLAELKELNDSQERTLRSFGQAMVKLEDENRELKEENKKLRAKIIRQRDSDDERFGKIHADTDE